MTRHARLAALRRCAALCAVGMAVAAQAASLPEGPVVRAGSVMLSRVRPDRLEIRQLSERAIVDWHAFDIGRDAVVDIVQPRAGAALLNRVTGSTPSTVAGTLRADSDVFLINPNGIHIARTGVISTGDFVASMLDIRDDHFMTANLRRAFTASLSDEDNLALLSRLKRHASGQAGPRARPASPGAGQPAFGVSHAGVILTEECGMVALVGTTIQSNGWIKASGGQVDIIASRVFLAGRISVDGAAYGVIDVVGRHIGVDDAMVSASGPASGGRIRISALALHDDTPTLTVSPTARLEADGWSAPETAGVGGGRIHLRSAGCLHMLGIASARAVNTDRQAKTQMITGEENHGGSIRIVGLSGLHVGGTFLVDHTPIPVQGVAAPQWGSVEFLGAGPISVSESAAGFRPPASRIAAASVSRALDGGHVVLRSRPLPSRALDAPDDASRPRTDTSIHIDAPVRWHADTTLRLMARGDVRVNAPIVGQGERAAVEIRHRREQEPAVDARRIALPSGQALLTMPGVPVSPEHGAGDL